MLVGGAALSAVHFANHSYLDLITFSSVDKKNSAGSMSMFDIAASGLGDGFCGGVGLHGGCGDVDFGTEVLSSVYVSYSDPESLLIW